MEKTFLILCTVLLWSACNKDKASEPKLETEIIYS
jgi:hypothetical protein